MRATDQYKNSGEAQLFALNKVNIYAHAVLSNDQKVLFDSAWEDHTLRIIHSYYHYLNLTGSQKEVIVATMESVPGFDSLKIIQFFPDIPKATMISLLDSTQLAAEETQQKQIKLNFENYLAEADSGRLQEAAFEKMRVEFILKYYTPHLQNEHKSILVQLHKTSMEDAKRVETISDLYQRRVKSDRMQEILKCYSSDSVLIAPINKERLNQLYERFSLQPNLCVYWCRFGTAVTPEIKTEENQILTSLEYIKLNYPEIINNSIHHLKKYKAKLNKKIERVRPPCKAGTVVNIVSDKRTESLSDIAELLLVQ